MFTKQSLIEWMSEVAEGFSSRATDESLPFSVVDAARKALRDSRETFASQISVMSFNFCPYCGKSVSEVVSKAIDCFHSKI